MTNDQLTIWRVHSDGRRAYREHVTYRVADVFADLASVDRTEIDAMLEEHGRVDAHSVGSGSLYTLLPAGVVWTPVMPEGAPDPDTEFLTVRTR